MTANAVSFLEFFLIAVPVLYSHPSLPSLDKAKKICYTIGMQNVRKKVMIILARYSEGERKLKVILQPCNPPYVGLFIYTKIVMENFKKSQQTKLFDHFDFWLDYNKGERE